VNGCGVGDVSMCLFALIVNRYVCCWLLFAEKVNASKQTLSR